MELNTNIEERIKTQFASTTKVLSFNTLRSRLNNGKTKMILNTFPPNN